MGDRGIRLGEQQSRVPSNGEGVLEGTFKQTFQPALKLLAHPERVENFLKGKPFMPVNVEVSPCHTCNATCDWCFYAGTHIKPSQGSMMDTQIAYKMLEDMAEHGVKAITWTGGGEPSLHKNFPDLVHVASDLGLKQGMFTNALLKPKYDSAKFEWIRISNTDHPWPVENMKLLRERTKKLGMAYNYAGNDEEVFATIPVGEEVGVDYIQIRQALNLRGRVTERRPPKIDHPLVHITDYKFDKSGNPHGYSQCIAYHLTPFIWHNGNVDVCGYHRETGGVYTLGNLHKQQFHEIMLKAPEHVPVIDTCQVCCRNHEENLALHNLKRLQDPDFL